MADIGSKSRRPPPPVGQALEQVADPLNGLGAHPDVMEQLRQLVWGYPALVHPTAAVIFAIGFSTNGIVVRLPPELRDVGLP